MLEWLAVMILLMNSPGEIRPHRKIIDGGPSGGGYSICSCYKNSRCDLDHNRCVPGQGTCEKCDYFDENGKKTGSVVGCPAEPECS